MLAIIILICVAIVFLGAACLAPPAVRPLASIAIGLALLIILLALFGPTRLGRLSQEGPQTNAIG